MRKLKNQMRFYFSPFLAGLILGTSYIPFPPWGIFFYLVPFLLFAERQKKLVPLLVGGGIMHITTALIIFHSGVYLIHSYLVMSWWSSVLLFSFFLVLFTYPTLISLTIWHYFRLWILKVCPPHPFRECIIWMALPCYGLLCARLCPVIFEASFGYTFLYAGLPVFQTAEVWGFQFLHTLTVLFNLPFYLIYKNGNSKISWKAGAGFAVLFCALNIWGMWLKVRLPLTDKKARVLMVQPNIPPKRHHSEEYKLQSYREIVVHTHNHLLYQQSFAPIDFVLWPEGSLLYTLPRDMKSDQIHLQKAIKKSQVPYVVTAMGWGEEGGTNSIFVFDKDGNLVEGPYNKSILLAFGEYMPADSFLPMKTWFPAVKQRLIRGQGENRVIDLDGLSLGFSICYEAVYDFYVRENSKNPRPDILINSSNDAWFGTWMAPRQNLYASLSRAIENRLPLVRITNSGKSAIMSRNGDLLFETHSNEEVFSARDVPYISRSKYQSPFFTTYGYTINTVFLWTFVLVSLLYPVWLTALKKVSLSR